MKIKHLVGLVPLLGALIIGCGSEQAPGYDSASRDAAEALAKNGNDISKLTPEQRSALENAAKKTRPEGGVVSSSGGGSGPPPSSGTTG